MDLAASLLRAAEANGIDALGFCTAEPFLEAREAIEVNKAAGRHGGMQFTYRNPARSTTPTDALPGARSIIVAALSFHAERTDASVQPAARIAKYVWTDRYAELRSRLEALTDVLGAAGHASRIVCDDNALVDRAAARRAGIGWQGKNTNILVPGLGSNVVLGSILTDADLPQGEPMLDGCGTCTRCVPACPTGALDEPGVLDASRCLAWLVQASGVFPREFRAALGDRIYGCDDCQEVCPPNRRAARVHLGDPGRQWAPLLDLLAMDDDTLIERYGAWYIPQRDPRYLRRNALVALGNTGNAADPDLRPLLEVYLDPADDLLCAHAIWAADALGIDHGLVEADLGPLSAAEVRAQR